MENNFCKMCGECCKNIKIDTINKSMYRDGIESIDEEFLSMLELSKSEGGFSYYNCKFLSNNKCINPNKPEICKKFPSSPFAFLPEDCGYEGVMFQENEKIKQKIRKLKEEIIHYNALIDTIENKSEKQQYQKIINSHNKFIQKYKQYNSEDW